MEAAGFVPLYLVRAFPSVPPVVAGVVVVLLVVGVVAPGPPLVQPCPSQNLRCVV